MKFLSLAVTAALLMGAPVSLSAAPCRDAKGHFTKCPEKAKPAQRCKDAKGKFAKCGTPGSKPV
jgi:hypothetical protein